MGEKVFIVEGTINEKEGSFEIIPKRNEEINFIVAVTEITIQSVADALVQDKKLFHILEGKSLEYKINKIEQHIIN